MKFNFYEYLNFNLLITPTVIKVVYILLSLGVIIGVLNVPSFVFENYPILRLLIMIIGLIGVRFACESIMIIYKIYENISNKNSDESK